MEKITKRNAAAILILALIIPSLALPAFAAMEQESKAGAIASPPYQNWNYDWPDMLVFKGVAVKDGAAVSAVFIAMGSDGSFGDFKNTTLIINGKSADLAVTGVERFPEAGVIALKFDGGKIVLKHYRIDWRDSLFASGDFGEWDVNMRLVGNMEDTMYRIMDAGVNTQDAPMPVEATAIAPAE